MKILIVDDNQVQAETLELTIKELIEDVSVIWHGEFGSAFGVLESQAPDAVVLDIYHGEPTAERPEGNAFGNEIWEKHFCPVVIYTAKPDESHHKMAENPFVKVIEKAGKRASDEAVVGELRKFVPHIETLRRIRDDAVRAVSRSLREVCSLIWSDTQDNEKRSELIYRITRRRVAALLDVTQPSSPIRAWERYVYPTICPELLTGDILQEQPPSGSPDGFRVVVSPSCDLIPGRANALSKVLVARCGSIEAYLKAATLNVNTSPAKLKDRLPPILNGLQNNGFLCLPALHDVVPLMAVNLRDLELVEAHDIAIETGATARFRRVVSVDSPFRESVAWTFTEVAGRPALPDIDHESTIEEIIATAAVLAKAEKHD